METPLSILYTYNLRGNLDLLPRLNTLIYDLRQKITGRVLLIDLGESCVPEVWPCGITEGRSTLLILEAMGYHAANVAGMQMTPRSYEKLAGQVMMALVDAEHPYERDGVVLLANASADATEMGLQIILTPGTATTLVDNRLTLAPTESDQVGLVHINGPALRDEIYTLSSEISADPGIAAVVELIVYEAQFYEERQ